MSRIEAWGAWPARVAWIGLALVADPTLGDAVAGRTTTVRVVVLVASALLWTAGLVALLVPRTASLTVLRIIVPAGLAASVISAFAGGPVDGWDLAAVTVATVAVLAALAPWVAAEWVDGSSYGTERRIPLRTPVAVAAVVAPLTWAAVVAGAAIGPLLLASGRWVPGLVATAVGAGLVWGGARSIHQLSRRWIVLVPAGLVVHDPLAMPEPQLFPRRTIARLGPAEVGSPAVDLTAGAAGLALELRLQEPTEMLVRGPGRGTSTHSTDAVLIAPARPAVMLDAAAERRIPVSR